MELKFVLPLYGSSITTSFNRTAYGIEIIHAAMAPGILAPFNRTAYGIEITFLRVAALHHGELLIAPLMELKSMICASPVPKPSF